MTRRPAKRAALKRRLQTRVAGQQVAYAAEVVNQRALDHLAIHIGTTQDGRLLMSRSNWRRALDAGAVAVEDRVAAIGYIQYSGDQSHD